ncbi:MAG: hypothetical protein DI538_09220 [Azospira oryzae]|jgi:1,4-dihydroxy-2-naphthoate octaprenyltransferase|nr:MAG: hypothetical protein DI538_09220 [Azospira oryzae]
MGVLRFYRYINILSIDVAIGAIVNALFFAQLFNVHILLPGIASLGLAVWIIYTTDHLRDAKRLKEEAATERHRFHQRHFKIILRLLYVAMLVELVLIFFLRKPVFYGGLWLSGGVVIYILINRWLRFFKEITGALLYSCGVMLPALSFRQASLTSADQLMIVQFVLIALINLILFSWMDYESDLKDRHRSLITYVSKAWGSVILIVLFMVTALCHFKTMYVHQAETLIFISMTFILLILFLFHRYFKKEERFRFIGDAIFFLPAIALFTHS